MSAELAPTPTTPEAYAEGLLTEHDLILDSLKHVLTQARAWALRTGEVLTGQVDENCVALEGSGPAITQLSELWIQSPLTDESLEKI